MEDLVVGPIVVPAGELAWSAVRASGPGGQNVNKVSTKVELRFDLAHTQALREDVRQRLFALARSRITSDGVLHVTSQLTRDQRQNLEDARQKLARMIEAALHVPRPRRATRPTAASHRRRLQDKRQRGDRKKQRSSRSED